ncbi:unnamed protein product [Rotaria sp. Silwood2]|nr:unnamed protein product [Rotaria sp. Silwood2]CAF2491072.1 unnamed protein product [Rotaria sp. Silwood2]CAF2721257.1 unnamed protein product [Rotaria sp. Silwood2]CAF2891095.1 unnamed protein product [Rotaria sp. Silwood2]CAF3972416.1 unnamed protein product [Rotaria sp. Silwood2]
MLSRRYLRRSLLTVLFSPIILLGLFAIYQNRHVIFPENSSYHHHHHHNEYDSHFSHKSIPNNKIRYHFLSKRLATSSSLPSKIFVNEKQQVKILSKTSEISSPLDILNNNQQIKLINSIQQFSPLQDPKLILKVIETKNLQRFVHLDLKGAAPKVVYFEKLFPYLKQLGANGLLMEYEDMFPFTEHLSILRHDLAYTKNDIQNILQLAEENNLTVMPLLQVYGHLEYVLKLKEFMHLREDTRYPQVITPCLEESYKLLFEMIDQLLAHHPLIPYLHIGCDEVYYRLIHPKCVDLHFRDEADLFIR